MHGGQNCVVQSHETLPYAKHALSVEQTVESNARTAAARPATNATSKETIEKRNGPDESHLCVSEPSGMCYTTNGKIPTTLSARGRRNQRVSAVPKRWKAIELKWKALETMSRTSRRRACRQRNDLK